MGRKSILIVDRNREFLNSSIEFLTMDMMIDIVTWADSVDEAAQKVKTYKPDMVLVDLGTEKYNGVEFSEWLKSLPYRPKVIVTSFCDNPEYRTFARSNGANGFIVKDQLKIILPKLIDIIFPNTYEKFSYMLN